MVCEVVTPVAEDSDARGHAEFQTQTGIGKRRMHPIKDFSATAEDVGSNTAASQLNGITKDQVSSQLMQSHITRPASKPVCIHADPEVAGEEEACSRTAAAFVVEIAMLVVIDGVIGGLGEVKRELLILEIRARSHRLFEFLGGHHRGGREGCACERNRCKKCYSLFFHLVLFGLFSHRDSPRHVARMIR